MHAYQHHTTQQRERDTHTHSDSDLGMLVVMMMVGLLSLKVFVRANIIPARTITGDDTECQQNILNVNRPKETTGSNYT